jgi:uncharacterized alkaline shock family protein YloU
LPFFRFPFKTDNASLVLPGGVFYHESHPCTSRVLFNLHEIEAKTMGEETTTLGTIHISPSALATIAYHATLTSYGVVGLAPRNLAEGLAMTITHEPARGISVNYNGEEINIDVHIIIEYGTRITSVAESVGNAVRYKVEKALGMPIHNVNVHVQDLRISNPD